MRLHLSPRTEDLAAALADLLARPAPGADALEPERVVVQSAGMARWLAMFLARRLGICANVEFEFPGKVLSGLTGPTGPTGPTAMTGAPPGPEARAEDPFGRDALRFRILARLPGLLALPAFAPLMADAGRFAETGVADARALSLADRLADLYDRYLTWRPDMVRDFEDGGADGGDGGDGAPESWQRLLWRDVVGSLPDWARAHLARRAERPFWTEPGRRLVFFGMPTLPPLYLDVLTTLAAERPDVRLELFIPVPIEVYAGDLVSPRQLLRALARGGSAAEHLALGHPLIHSLGRLAVDFQGLLEERGLLDAAVETPHGAAAASPGHDAPAEGSLLARLQADLLAHRPPAPSPVGRDGPAGLDDSLRIHACHSPLRQVETLRDELLSMLAADPTLTLRDIAVLTPDIDAMAPYIEAVFRDPEATPAVRFHIADRSLAGESPWAAALTAALHLAGGRRTASEVLDLLALPPLQRRFGLDEGALATVGRLLLEAGIRWGEDAAHRGREGQPPDAQNTWRFGLDRLLLGLACPDGAGPVAGVLPLPDVEGDAALALGRLIAALDVLFPALTRFETPAPADIWSERLVGLLDAWIGAEPGPGAPSERAASEIEAARVESAPVRQALLAVFAKAAAADFGAPLDLGAARALAVKALGQADEGAKSFLSGGVTFCALLPMRSIPFRAICLLGMDDGAFPRNPPRPAFDHMARKRRPGDRSPRDDDRYLFLEALLACRGKLRIFFTGNDVRTNAPRPPSVVVAELIDVLEQMGVPEERLVVRHPLQSFSPRRFGAAGPGPTPETTDVGEGSFDARAFAGAQALLGARRESPPFIAGPVSGLPPGPLTLSLGELRRFLESPSNDFLRRLGVEPLGQEAVTPEREPFELDALEIHGVRSAVLGALLAGEGPDAARRRPRLSGALPLGTPGEALGVLALHEAAAVAEAAAALCPGPAGGPVEVRLSLTVDGRAVSLVGAIDRVFRHPTGERAPARVAARVGRIGGKVRLGGWLSHLAWQLAEPGAGASWLVGLEAGAVTCFGWDRLDEGEAEAALAGLLRLYVAGRSAPVRLFPRTSEAFEAARQAALAEGQSEGAAFAAGMAAAAPVFEGAAGGRGMPGEGDEPAAQRIYGGAPLHHLDTAIAGLTADPDTDFAAVAGAVFGPLLAAGIVPEDDAAYGEGPA